ncbi:hypothetical protein HOD75_01970 [archaeon]|nr:hypothetical protein [archaeon]MBT4241644.1 hypothetical protein [archaeon]MBT4418039.1 hypothetical protein [archaeon]
MNFLRSVFDHSYDVTKPLIFLLTNDDPEIAHSLFTIMSKTLYHTGLAKAVLDNSSNESTPNVPNYFPISNAAGLNKNGRIPPTVLKYLGFDRNVVGTVTGDAWEGNPRPRAKRFPKTKSIVNWMGLPGVGAKRVAKIMESYGDYEMPTTINLMTTPGKTGDDVLWDLKDTLAYTRILDYVDRFELNISCPNTHSGSGELDARRENLAQLRSMLGVVFDMISDDQDLYLKVSPDLTEEDVEGILDVTHDFRVAGYTTTNTTTNHDPYYIPESLEKGGGSGDVVEKPSLRVQKLFCEKLKENQHTNPTIIACGGISSIASLEYRMHYGASEIQLYTPLIFEGPKLLREFRDYFGNR